MFASLLHTQKKIGMFFLKKKKAELKCNPEVDFIQDTKWPHSSNSFLSISIIRASGKQLQPMKSVTLHGVRSI